ncbi:hypothetical protein ABB37_01204 [Leptomonas pyrrhocoris]|uniref:Uncharacterized protein n=1 Tax=Leptomonas pyrrhocoris TaxID=157538 RepID=A0A0M9G8K7_LEPPY|nr:hypothetical protein ABB37_01204 [Leptomonas pyrrhocoris]XP_015663139.1 hypothetical protein ABB37_01204 [Leptomonas pyrrhocoris]KPA84699.1 hypothetical protein ABB37_01204 [Leptomonas pyrrhocoris]KPA84700.1 hypothetical protein ABB37_01204 [Leptomonas pyrrhocoris]|eukprot:XP_015663138.1 hypothetical protein ABB37_01204 [Leptomonas pyrrhocoris]
METPLQFRTRRPPKQELYSKLFVLFLFGVFCALVGCYVGPLPLPEAKHSGGVHPAVQLADVEVFTFSTLSPEDRAQLAELRARLSVPYLTPWGADERPALFFLWHLLYRSLKPDLEHFTADLRNVTMTVTPEATAGPPNNTETTAIAADEKRFDKLQVVIQVVETEQGYITASLARFLPQALVFSVVANSSAERRRSYQHYRDAHNAENPARVAAAKESYTSSPQQRAYSEQVAAKVERVLTNPAAEGVTEASQLPGMHHLPVSAEPVVSSTPSPNTAGGDVTTDGAVTPQPTSQFFSPRLFLCVPAGVFNGSYYTDPTTQQLTVNYQVLLSPYIALRAARTAAEFDATLRAIFTRANVASFIALPWLWDDDAKVTDASPRHRVYFYAQELADFDHWYGDDEGYPLRVLARALRVPEVEAKYHVSIVALGAMRWDGALRELFRVELAHIRAAAESRPTPNVTTATKSPANATETVDNATALSTTSPASFGCAARSKFLNCAPRAQHASCERFSDSVLS